MKLSYVPIRFRAMCYEDIISISSEQPSRPESVVPSQNFCPVGTEGKKRAANLRLIQRFGMFLVCVQSTGRRELVGYYIANREHISLSTKQ
jgi:hypothetical protein